jgi:hypothetical protein
LFCAECCSPWITHTVAPTARSPAHRRPVADPRPIGSADDREATAHVEELIFVGRVAQAVDHLLRDAHGATTKHDPSTA